ncbi:hypothetical protein AB0A63_31350 [Lentzea sp. NPDC042327]|uniref:hypothetical protein n=1 Tax=Lentzea sp. NPDC042327 TaxID=3154801 RepID=UPI0033E19BCF
MRSAVLTEVSRDDTAPRHTLARAIFDTDDLTTFLTARVGVGPLTNELQYRRLRPPGKAECKRLLLPLDLKNVLVRKGITRTAIQTARPPLVLVSYVAVVVRFRLPEAVRKELEHGSIGLGEALRPHGVRRHVTDVQLTSAADRIGGQRFVRVKATLSLPGAGPVALLDEILYASAVCRARFTGRPRSS